MAQAHLAEGMLNGDDEIVVKLADGCTIRSGAQDKGDGALVSGDYVRVCEPDGTEYMYWHYDEWAADPQLVMGAIINTAAGLRLRRPTVTNTEWPDNPTDQQVLDAIATLLGTSRAWNADTLTDIANLIGQVRPHPGDAPNYADDFHAATGRLAPAAWFGKW